MALFLLSESASGYALFKVVQSDTIAAQVDSMQDAISDYSRFSKMVQLTAFAPFQTAKHALLNANMISEGTVSEYLENFLETNIPKKSRLGVHRDPKMKSAVADVVKAEVFADDSSDELLRGIRMHFHKFVSALSPADAVKAQLGLAHSYSRSKVKFNVHKSDNMIIQSIALLDQLDKDINTFAMRVREWYSWHFPELIRVVTDNIQYARVVAVIKNKSTLTEDSIPGLTEVLMNETLAVNVLEAAKYSMGTDISDIDLINIEMFAKRVVQLAEYRSSLHAYLSSKMTAVAPNLAALIGDQVGARLISHAGSLTSLAKYPASTVQILGAEKALFRALKTKGKTPKYGLLYHSTFIGRAKTKNKGRISRYLANKCSIASRMDCFSEANTDVFGKKLREQVEERLRFYETGAAPRKNIDVMKEAIKEASALTAEDDADDLSAKLKPVKIKKEEDVEMEDSDGESDGEEMEVSTPKDQVIKKKKKKSSSKKEKSSSKKEKSSSKKEKSAKKEKSDKMEKSDKKEKKRKRESLDGSGKKRKKNKA